ncbi:MAG: DUF3747 domain-containing protein [Vulcanococcus sp.]|jgi:hypothetical protein|uniref:DUF3747 domain-containing protein n=1 Tax=Vulcanococcus sp. TaxID=2856995 RepID=UPI0025F264E0|nr:DUF3747 domain-containing protein [Vulcanococcus sp.]MBW0173872.1 DUF3747 domain-containing protein [Vulcanococcus sp.]MBW0181826.1 DUF3747 domain-containing protein [Vulcanococcus sp.]
MQRTYLPLLALSAAIAAPAWAASVFTSQPLDQARFAVLAQPVGRSDWKLLVLEQIKPEPLCWEKRSDGLIDPALNRFDFSGICSRYIDSNGYSLRVGDEDLASRYRLRLEQQGNKVSLLAMTPSQPTELLVGRGTVGQRDREGFVAIELEPGWSLERRAYGSQTLSHVYFANGTPLSQLIAKASRGSAGSAPAAPATVGKLKPLPPQPGSGPIALQVIPFKP